MTIYGGRPPCYNLNIEQQERKAMRLHLEITNASGKKTLKTFNVKVFFTNSWNISISPENFDKVFYFIRLRSGLKERPSSQEVKQIFNSSFISKVEQETEKGHVCGLTACHEWKKILIRQDLGLKPNHTREEVNFILNNLNVKASGLYDIAKERKKLIVA